MRCKLIQYESITNTWRNKWPSQMNFTQLHLNLSYLTITRKIDLQSKLTRQLVGSSKLYDEGKDHERYPMIKFIGKRSREKMPAVKLSPIPEPVKSVNLKPSSAVEFTTLKGGAMFGRPKLSAAEMEAIESGGAY